VIVMARFDGKVALITGGASGMGRDTALAFAAEGAQVAVLDVRPDRAQQTVDLVIKPGGIAAAFPADVRDEAQVELAVAAAIARFGRIDILLNNAGTTRPGSVVEIAPEDWDFIVDVNLKGTYLVSRAVLPQMLERGSGAVINIGSVSGMRGDRRAAAYNAAKAGVINLTRSMALDFGPQGIRVNCICPGAIGTPVIQRMLTDEARAAISRNTPAGRIGEGKEVANLTLFLASDAASYINGAIIPADGGLTAWNGLP
jgi:meso-butanediol dehydrogenase / (S,S)-butanediol dehydrogenase / diacetyl reductase